jgi:hypothetical protein
MCEEVSFVVDEENPNNLYFGIGLNSHAVGGPPPHDSLTVRHEDSKIAKMILGMLKDRFANRTQLINSISEARNEFGDRMLYSNGVARLPEGITEFKGNLYLNNYGFALPEGLVKTGYLNLNNYGFALPAGLVETGNLNLNNYGFALPAGLVETGNLNLGNYGFALPAGLVKTGYMDLGNYGFALPAGLVKTGDLYLNNYGFALPAGLKHFETRSKFLKFLK